MTTKIRTIISLASMILFAGCGNSDKTSVPATKGGSSVSPSAHTGKPSGTANLRVPTVPVRDFIISPTEPGWELTNINQIIVTENGWIYALDSYDQSVRVFGPSGELLRRLGRKGAGPGEFTNANEMCLIKDSLLIFESFSNRVTTFPLNGSATHTRMIRLSGTTSSSIRARTTNGYLFTTSNMTDLIPTSTFVTALPTGVTQAVLFDHLPVPPMLKFDLTIENVKGSKYGITYAPQPLVLVRVDLQGDTIWSRNLPIEPSLVSDAQVIRLVNYLAAPQMFKGVTSVGDQQMISDSLHRERLWPPVRDVHIGLDHVIWITIGGPPWERVHYWKLSPTGEREAVVELPAEFRLLWANRDYVWGTRTNENFELTIERYRLPN